MEFCCENMREFVSEANYSKAEIYKDSDVLIVYIPKFEE